MKKKMLTAAVIFITLFLFITAGWYLMYIYLGWGAMPPFMKVRRVEQDPINEFMAEDASLMAVVESEEEAMEIAEKYMIEFVSFQKLFAILFQLRLFVNPYNTKANPGGLFPPSKHHL